MHRAPRAGDEQRLAGDVIAVLVGLVAPEPRHFNLDVACDKASGDHALRSVRAVKPVMTDRCFRIVLDRQTVDIGGRAKRRIAHLAIKEVSADLIGETV